MKRILFLDLDGVLAGEAYFKKLHESKQEIDFLDEEKVQKLNSLDCEVVISSSWGEDGGNTLEKLRQKGFNLEVIGYTEHFYNDWIVRGNEIKKWLEDNMKDKDYQYAILDDDSDMLLEQKEHFVHVNSYEALTDEDVENVRKILESDII